MTSVDAGWAPLHEASRGLACLRVDGGGRLSLVPSAVTTRAEELADALCGDLNRLFDLDVTPVVVRSVREAAGGVGGLVTIREIRQGEAVFTTATAGAASECEAIVLAILEAVGANHDVLCSWATRLSRWPGVTAVSAIDADGWRYPTGEPEGAAHLALVAALPAPGRLTVATAGAEHRVLCLTAAALVVTVAAGDAVGAAVDRAFARIESAVYEGLLPL